MSIFDINYNNVVDNLLVPQYRTTRFKRWMYSLIYPIQFLRNIFFNNYVNSNTYTYYNGIDNINIIYSGTMVRFPNLTVWMTTQDNIDINTYNPTIGQTTDIQGNTVWIKIQDDFIGFEERTHFCNQKIMFEYLLNRYFKLYTGGDYIEITTNDTAHNTVFIAQEAEDSTVISQTDNDSLFYIGETGTEDEDYNFTIYVPEQVSIDLGINYESMIRQIADKYSYFGLIYKVVIYY